MNNPYRDAHIILYSPPVYTLIGRARKWIKRLHLWVRGSYKRRFYCKCLRCGSRYKPVYSVDPVHRYRIYPNAGGMCGDYCLVCSKRSTKNLKAETAYISLVEQLVFDFNKRPPPFPPKRLPAPISIQE